MHIVMLSDIETLGGAAVAASRLATGLCQAGHRVTRVVWREDAETHPWETYVLKNWRKSNPAKRIIRKMVPSRLQNRWNKQDSIRTLQKALSRILLRLSPDVINLHNLHGAAGAGWTHGLAQVCAELAPTVWTLHDMWSITGRCAYNYDCRKFITGCDSTCPTPTEYPALEPQLIAQAWEDRRRIFDACPNLTIVSPSRWLANEAISGLWQKHRIEVIPYGLPLDIYRPLDRAMARAALGVETTGPVLLVAAQNLVERRKGGTFLVDALQAVSHQPLTIVTLGNGRLQFENNGLGVHDLGYVDHERTRVLAYNAADLFVHPAPVDNLPNVVMEAIACGTPVVGFPIGGVPEMVRPGLTGWLAEEVSSNALAKTIDRAIRDLNVNSCRKYCRAVAESDYRVEQQAQRYIELFASMQVPSKY